MRIFKRLLRWASVLALCGLLLACIGAGVAYWLVAPRLPDVATLKDIHLQVPLRVLSGDGKLIATFGEARRIPVSIDQVPARLKEAVLSAEDADFYHHPGVDWRGIVRAGWHVLITGGGKGQGGSTITQQVARNFFLSPEKLYSRKITEIFIALRMEHELSKDQILALYLNKMFLGHRSYGIGAAAEYYYGKSLNQLTVAECALIAATFQLPSAVNPINNPKRAIERRNWVLGEMLRHGYISKATYQESIAEANHAYPHDPPVEVDAPYLAEMVRQQVLDRFGNAALTEGYVVRTTVNSTRQNDAVRALRTGLIAYDHAHGWRGPEAQVKLAPNATVEDYVNALDKYVPVSGLQPGIVTVSDASHATVYRANGESIELNLSSMSWARPYKNDSRVGAPPTSVDKVLARGDIIRTMQGQDGSWQLAQIPEVQGALASINPEDGAVEALVGGFNFERSKFNRATMAARQPGSSFKPYLYSAAFERGFTPASIVNDAPLALPDPSKPEGIWTPANDDSKFGGPTRLREALVRSLNLVSVRLLDAIGIAYTREYVTRFGFPLDSIPENLTMALGTASVTPMDMARGYAVFANGGYLVTPYFIKEIDNRSGKPLYVPNPARACRDCKERLLDTAPPGPPPPRAAVAPTGSSTSSSTTPPSARSSDVTGGAVLPADVHDESKHPPVLAPHVIDVRNDFLITSLMKDVILRGTGAAARALGRDDLAGKTGSTNDHRDAWFVGFNADLATAVWVGFDNYSSLGHGEFGAKAALPIWMEFMGDALKGQPSASLPMPPGITTLLINKESGLPTTPDDPNSMPEIFKVEDVDKLRKRAAEQKGQQHAYDIF
ncbi:MAG: penicillin-binding protein 1A [Rhodanobacter sp.]